MTSAVHAGRVCDHLSMLSHAFLPLLSTFGCRFVSLLECTTWNVFQRLARWSGVLQDTRLRLLALLSLRSVLHTPCPRSTITLAFLHRVSLHRHSPARRLDTAGSGFVILATAIVGSAISRPWSNRTALVSREYEWKTAHPRTVERCPLLHPPFVFPLPCSLVHGSPTAHILVCLVLLPSIPVKVGSHNCHA